MEHGTLQKWTNDPFHEIRAAAVDGSMRVPQTGSVTGSGFKSVMRVSFRRVDARAIPVLHDPEKVPEGEGPPCSRADLEMKGIRRSGPSAEVTRVHAHPAPRGNAAKVPNPAVEPFGCKNRCARPSASRTSISGALQEDTYVQA